MRLYTKILGIIFTMTLLASPAHAQSHKTVKKKSVAVVDQMQKKVEQYEEAPILKVMFIDSLKTKTSQLTENIMLPEHAGKLIQVDGNIGYENEFAGIRLLTKKNSKGQKRIYQQMYLGKEWSTPVEVVIDEDFTELCSPWLMPDGQTLYFSARKQHSEDENDSFCLYTSTLNTSTQEFMKPQLLPMPLNGDTDDIYYIENETDHVAYFVTTRYQDKGFVTLYTLKPNEPWVYYDNEELESEKLVSLAELWKISDTWESAEKRNNELLRVKELSTLYAPKESKTVLVTLANGQEITDVSQLKSATAKALLRRYLELQGRIAVVERQLSEYRSMFRSSKESTRKPLSETILSLEKYIQDLHKQLRDIHNELMTTK